MTTSPSNTLTDPGDGDRRLKATHRAMWALGNYAAVARQVISELGPTLVRAADIQPGQRVLDVAAGSGNVAIPAALAGADVVASDLCPELLEAGRHDADARHARLAWEEGDAEALPYADAEFDAVTSCVGVMFAPHHQAAADELVRVCRPGGTLGLISWTPEGFIGQMFATMKPYAAPPPEGAQPPPLWGREAHVTELLGDKVTDLRATKQTLRVTAFDSPEAFRDFFKATYGPTIAVYRRIAEQPDQVEALDQALAELARGYCDESGAMDWEYLLITARRR